MDLGLLQSQEWSSLWHFCAALRASAGYHERVFERNSHKVTRNADSSSHVGQPGLEFTHPSSHLVSPAEFPVLPPSLDCRLSPISVDYPVLCPGLFCQLLLTLWPSFPRPLRVSWEISRACPLCGFSAKTYKGIFWLALTHTYTTNAQHRITHKKD